MYLIRLRNAYVDCSGMGLCHSLINVVGCPIWVCIGNLVYYLAVQPIDDMVYKLSDLVKLIVLYKLAALTLFEQHSYLAHRSMYKQSDIDHIDYVLIFISFSKLLYAGGFNCSIYGKQAYIQHCFICHTLAPSLLILKGTCEATVRAISIIIIVRLSNALKILVGVVRTTSSVAILHKYLTNCFVGCITFSVKRCVQ